MDQDQGSNNMAEMWPRAETSEPASVREKPPKKKVGFTGGAESADKSTEGTRSPQNPTPSHRSPDHSGYSTPSESHSRRGSEDFMLLENNSRSHLPELSPQQTREIHQALHQSFTIPKPRPAIRRQPSNHSDHGFDGLNDDSDDDDGSKAVRRTRATEAFERAKQLELDERGLSAPNSRYNSPERSKSSFFQMPTLQSGDGSHEDLNPKIRNYDREFESVQEKPWTGEHRTIPTSEAHKLVRKHTIQQNHWHGDTSPPSGARSGVVTPTEEQHYAEDYKPPPDEYRGGILGALLKLYGQQQHHHSGHGRSSNVPRAHDRYDSSDMQSGATTPQHSPPDSGSTTPTGSHWFGRKHGHHSTSSLTHLIGSSASLGSPSVTTLSEQVTKRLREQRDAEKARPGLGKRVRSSGATAAFNRISRPRLEEEIRITVHIAETIARQKYLMKLCGALMLYGAPTHRLEEYMKMSARVLEIQAQFLYIPGSMIMSFDDPSTHTTEVKLVKVNQGLDLGKLRDVHEVYKDVVHDRIGVEEASIRLKEVTDKKNKHSVWFRIPVFGLAAVCVGPYAFGARLIDLPIAFLLGCILGVLQLVIAPKSDLYANVFEISATVITSFLARAFGSIRGGDLFCFSALAQSSIALILPGYTVLCASLELQSKSIVAGSVRMVYAIIYSLFLGYGITIGSAIYGIMDKNATSATTCSNSIQAPYFFPFVVGFTICLIIINQAKWKQAPIMIVISFVGYLVNFYSSKRFTGNTQVSNTLGALAIGVMANLNSRIGGKIENYTLDLWEDRLRPRWKTFQKRLWPVPSKASAKSMEEGRARDHDSPFVRQTRRVGYGLAAAAMLPAIFVQVPSGLSVQGSLVSGIASANQISGNATNGSSVANVTTLSTEGAINSTAFTVGYSVIQVAIGITVGLFLSAIVVYPFGKRRSGLFSF